MQATGEAGSRITFENVGKVYGRTRVVEGFSLDVEPGEFFAMLGPSGSGKTTALMMLAGFTDVTEGRISVDGRDVSRLDPRDRGFGMVFQNYAIFPHLNVFENVAFPLRARGISDAVVRARVDAALRAVRLEHLADRFSRQLSGGQQQRVAIARAISFEPHVILMDEPLGALDKNLRYAMQVEIKELQKRLGMTCIYVTHDQEEAMNMSDRIAIMNNGKIEQVGPPREVYERPISRFVARFLGEANVIEGRLHGTDSVEAAGIRMTAAAMAEPLAPGSAVALFIRPEKLSITSAGVPTPEGRGAISGRVAKVSFLGNITRYGVRTAFDEDLLVDVTNASDLRHAEGAAVTLSWAPGDARILVA